MTDYLELCLPPITPSSRFTERKARFPGPSPFPECFKERALPSYHIIIFKQYINTTKDLPHYRFDMVIRRSNFLKFFVDITGVPKRNRSGSYEDVTISSVSVNTYKLEEIFNELEHRFPGCAKKKGHNLQATQLMDIIEFLNEHDIRMTTVTFEKDDWEYYRKEYPNESNIEEKIMGILYFYTIKRVAWKNYEYQVLVDNDTSFNIKQSILICQRLARMHDYHFNVTFGYLDLTQL